MFAATVLGLEAFVVLFAGLAAYGLRLAPGGVIFAVAGVTALWCLLAAGTLRNVVGYVLGSAVQVALLLAGALIPDLRVHLLPLAIVFALLWAISWQLGRRIDAERAVRHEAEVEHWRAQSEHSG